MTMLKTQDRVEEENTSTSDFQQILAYISIDHEQKLTVLRSLISKLKDEELTLTEMVDIGYLLRECEKHLDEMRKDFKAHKEKIGKVVCHVLALQDRFSHSGELATGSAKASYHSAIPHPEHQPEAFAKICEWFNIDVGTGPVGAMRFHWPTIKKYITDAMERGEELPLELSDIKVDLEITYRRRTNGKDE